MGKITKKVLVDWVDFECKRKLFLDLAFDDTNWIYPFRQTLQNRKLSPKAKMRFGSEFATKIYHQILTLPNVVANVKPDNKVAETVLKAQFLQNANYEKPLILLEHSFKLPKNFWDIFFPEVKPQTVSDRLTPDIIILKRIKGNEKVILPSGQIGEIPAEVENPIGISILDVKITHEESINKKHFVEILHYITALNLFLQEKGLDNRFFILANENGILANKTKKEELRFHTFKKFMEIPVTFRYEDIWQIYSNVVETIKDLNRKVPLAIESVPVRVRPECGRCMYLEDCKQTLGSNGPPKNMKIELLPYLDPSTGEELKSMGIETIGDLQKQINSIKIEDIPKPIYAELPLLKLKTEAILSQSIKKAKFGEAFSASIPKYSDFSITFDASLDPINDIVYYIGIFFSIYFGNKSPHSKCLFETWEVLNLLADKDVKNLDDPLIIESVAKLRQHTPSVTKHNLFRASIHLKRLKTDETLKWKLQQLKDGDKKFELNFAYVINELDPNREFFMAKRTIQLFETLISLTSYLEEIIQVKASYEGRTYVSSPVTAAYYWSYEVLASIESLMERHLQRLIFEKETREKIQKITSWLTPKESQVKNNLLFKKIYDLRLFSETIMGFPTILNYTWHEIAKHYLENHSINHRYWRDHFNYMEFNMWHLAIEEEDELKKSRKIEELRAQVIKKVRVLDRIRVKFQGEARDLISSQSKPVKNRTIRVNRIPNDFHNIAKAWLMFAKLTGTFQELQAEYFKHMFPDFSIAKLMAAEINSISKNKHTGKRGGTSFQYLINITGLSTNVKFSVGDMAIMCPDKLRDFPFAKFWIIRIQKMEWKSDSNSFELLTDSVSFDIDSIQNEHKLEPSTKWYLYPYGGDFWSTKLDYVLKQRNIGSSWFGKLLDWSLQLSENYLKPPKTLDLDIAEIYLFQPKKLGEIKPNQFTNNLVNPLQPMPDVSQRKSISSAMNSIITLIQGPPGTGKSQTIANLINEIIERSEEPVKILVSAFSYQAMHVVLNKLNNSYDKSGNPSRVASATKIFVRSPSKQLAEGAEDLVRENRAWKLNGESRIVTKKKRLTDRIPATFIMFANPQQVVNLHTPIEEKRVFDEGFSFDYIICDEASQMPLDQFLSLLLFVKKVPAKLKLQSELAENGQLLDPTNFEILLDNSFEDFTKIILVGDHFQLPPVQPLNPPKKLEPLLGSVFSYFVEIQELEPNQLTVNYRSNAKIVEYTKALDLYQNLTCSSLNKNFKLEGDLSKVLNDEIKFVLDPNKVLITIIHNSEYDTALSVNETLIASSLVEEFYNMVSPKTKTEEISFWSEKIGIVAPHNAQGRFIIRDLFHRMERKSKLSRKELMEQLRNTTFSVEKFQGSDRDFIIGTIGISSRMQLQKEEEFIYELNRFNVLTSRAKRKIVLVVSSNFLNYIPRRRTAMENAARIRLFSEMCKNTESITFTFENRKIQTRVRYSFLMEPY